MRKVFSRLALSARLRKGARVKSKQRPEGPGASNSQPGLAHDASISLPEGGVTSTPTQQQPDPADPSHQVDSAPVPKQNPSPTLDTLPAELRRLILTLLATTNASSLRALVTASPVFYQQYLLDRRPLLRSVLKSARGIPLAEAYALHASTRLYYSKRQTADPDAPAELADPLAIRGFVDAYRDLRRMTGEEILEGHCTEEDLAGMVGFYEAVARPLVGVCAGRFLGRLKPAPEVGVLSGTEVARLLRGLYRYQIYCNLFGQGQKGRRTVPELAFEGEQLELFFCLFVPWEIDEIYCVYVLVRDVYGWVMDGMEAGGDGEKMEFGDWKAPLAGSKKDLRNSPHRCSQLEGAALRGLLPFSRLLMEGDHDKMGKMLRVYLVDGSGNIEHALSRPNQASRRRRNPQDGDGIEAMWERLRFDGDVETGPPLAWVIYWKGHYVNRYGDALEPSVQRWGYVFWDNRRLVKSQGLEELLNEREVFRRW